MPSLAAATSGATRAAIISSTDGPYISQQCEHNFRETLSKHTCHGGTGEERLDPVGFAKPVRGSPASVGSGKVDAG